MLTIKYELEWSQAEGPNPHSIYVHGEAELIKGSKSPKPGDTVTVKPRKGVLLFAGTDPGYASHTFDGVEQIEGVVSMKSVTDHYDGNRDIVYTVETIPN